MADRLGKEVPSQTARAWDSVRRVREPVAWTLLVITALAVLVTAWQLIGLPGAGLPGPPVLHTSPVLVTPGSSPAASAAASPAGGPAFALRASAVAPQFVAGGIITLPVLSVILAAFAGGVTDRARQVVQAAVTIQGVALGLGLLSWLGAFGGHVRPGVWFIFDAIGLAALAAALVFTVAVLRSPGLQPLTPQPMDGGEGDEGSGEDT
jgi:hypothetical protein